MLHKTYCALACFLLVFCCTPLARAAEGDQLWNGSVGGAGFTWSTPVLTDTLLIIQGQDGGITGLNKSDGTQAWYTAGVTGTIGSPVLYGNKLYLISDETMYRIAPDTGTIEDTRALGESFGGLAPTVHNDRIYFSTYNSGASTYTLHCASTSTLADIWTKTLSGHCNTMTDGQVLYVLSDTLRAYNLLTGTLLWTVAPTGVHTYFDMGAIAGGWLVAVSDGGGGSTPALNAFTLDTDRTAEPTLRWKEQIADGSMADSVPPVVDNNRVYINSRAGVLQARSLSTGSLQWSQTVRGSGWATALPVVANDQVFIETESGVNTYKTCYDAATGTPVWQTLSNDLGIAWGQPTLDPTGVYLACDHGNGVFKFERAAASETWSMLKNNAQQTSGQLDLDPPLPPDVVLSGQQLLLLN